MPPQKLAGPSSDPPNPRHAFLNIPYDEAFQNLYLAYIAGITAFGLVPKATLEVATERMLMTKHQKTTMRYRRNWRRVEAGG